MLRAAVRERTPLGIAAKEVIDSGGLMGDEIMVGLVRERLDRDTSWMAFHAPSARQLRSTRSRRTTRSTRSLTLMCPVSSY
jgi:adenylate kinase family enzyme